MKKVSLIFLVPAAIWLIVGFVANGLLFTMFSFMLGGVLAVIGFILLSVGQSVDKVAAENAEKMKDTLNEFKIEGEKLVSNVITLSPEPVVNINVSGLVNNRFNADYINATTYRTLKTSFVALDVETTGLHPPHDKIIEVALIKYKNGVEVDRFVSLVNPCKKIPHAVTRINNITDGMVADAPRFSDIEKQLIDFIGEETIVAHNASFDMKFLLAELAACGHTSLDFGCVDTLPIAKGLPLDVRNHKLQTVLDAIGYEGAARHRGASDCEGCTAILLYALAQFEKDYRVNLVSNSSAAIQKNIASLSELKNIKVLLQLNDEPGKGFYMAVCNGLDVGRLPKSANKFLKDNNYTLSIHDISKDSSGKYSVAVDMLDFAN